MITLQFAEGTGVTSRMIEWFGHGKFSHVDIVWPTGDLYGARLDGGVQLRGAGYLGSTKVCRVNCAATPAVEREFYAFLLAQKGKPYDRAGILGFFSGRNWRDPDSWFCSELAAAALEQSHWFAYPLAVNAGKITPDDLALILSALVPVSCA